MDIIRVALGDYPRYEDLLLKCDMYKKEAELYKIAYDQVFGDLEQELFKLKILCIEYKKLIRYCQIEINKGKRPDFDKIENSVSEEMQGYYSDLEAMVKYHREIQELKTVTEEEMARIKQTYRNIAKLIHPDINSAAADSEVLSDLWNRTVNAYRNNDLKKLEELEFLVNRTLEELGMDHNSIVVADIEMKIMCLENEIKTITSTDPYRYKYLLEDEDKIKSKEEEFEREIDEHSSYLDELRDKYKELGGF